MRITIGLLILLIYGCSGTDTQQASSISISKVSVPDAPVTSLYDSLRDIPEQNLLTKKSYEYLFNPLLADGFDYAVGNVDGKGSYLGTNGKTYNGWYVAVKTAETYSLGIHTGEDWNGNGGGDTDKGQPAYAVAKGIVKECNDFGFPWGNVVLMEHVYLENAKEMKCYSLYAHLDSMVVSKGDTLMRRQIIGTIGTGGGAYPAHLHLEIRKPSMKDYAVTYWPSSNAKDTDWVKDHYFSPTDFIKTHRTCPIPAKNTNLIVACKKEMEIHYFNNGTKVCTYNIAVGQNPIGHKERQGDNRTPEGAYKIIQKSSGPFSGDYGDFFGSGWMRISYPNAYDAEEGFSSGLISKSERDKIIDYTKSGKEPPKTTELGGGIGIHGWAGNWDPSGSRALTWGCISINNYDLKDFYELAQLNSDIYILP